MLICHCKSSDYTHYLHLPSTNYYQISIFWNPHYPLARRKAPAEGRRPEGEGANIDRRLVPYHGKCRRIQSRIEFIYLYIYGSTAVLFATACEGWVLGKTFEENNKKSTDSS